jgi:hypothetical protein
VLNKNWSCYILHDSLDQIQFVYRNNLSIRDWEFPIHGIFKRLKSLAEIIFGESLTDSTLLEVCHSKNHHFSICLAMLEAIEYIILVIVNDFAVFLLLSNYRNFLNSDSSFKIKVVGVLDILYYKNLTICSKR